jgi:hypothetical protein
MAVFQIHGEELQPKMRMKNNLLLRRILTSW